MSFAVISAVFGCVVFETCQQIAFSLSGRLKAQKWRWLILGAVCYLVELFFWFRVLELLPLGIAVPLISANYITVSLASHFLFGEHLDVRHWGGIACIVLGMVFIAQQGM
ncbi:MAG TPA: EamA family transporter [Oculatellaceae cyanobacterium]|jgi:undecaprenyl phosphate-alpha-L-ara4N flippase subunit ArnE